MYHDAEMDRTEICSRFWRPAAIFTRTNLTETSCRRQEKDEDSEGDSGGIAAEGKEDRRERREGGRVRTGRRKRMSECDDGGRIGRAAWKEIGGGDGDGE